MSLPDQKKANVEQMFFEGKLLVDGLNPTPTTKMQAMGMFACNLILAILDKRHKELPRFGSVEDAGCQLVGPSCSSFSMGKSSPRRAQERGKEGSPIWRWRVIVSWWLYRCNEPLILRVTIADTC